ncbi:sensor histidine kinase [Lysinibacillus sp. 54212]|uniref:sensor histidine kinase n=1 Tax=Lysinibacillus sp. 54212 TaxID=3119829 RepID=UPI002FC8EAC5
MKNISIKFPALFIIIITIITHTYLTEASKTAAFFSLAIILCLYFITPLMNKTRIISYSIISIVLFTCPFLSLDIMYMLPLVAFILIEGAYILNAKSYYILVILNIALASFTVVLKLMPFYGLLLLVALAVSSLTLRYYIGAYLENRILYEELLGQYRELKRLSLERDQLARVEERTKIARDMHDSVGHNLTSLLMQVEMLSIKNSSPELEEIKSVARKSLDETRYAVRQLKSSESYGLQSVLQLIRKLETESRLHIRFTIEKGVLSLPISNNQSIVLYRVLQECLTNAMKYSDSKEVDITLGKDSLQNILFIVKNKSLTQTPSYIGFGLKNMEERLQEIGGVLRVNRIDHQFIVRGSFPMKGEQ